jgi:hypothetical protein
LETAEYSVAKPMTKKNSHSLGISTDWKHILEYIVAGVVVCGGLIPTRWGSQLIGNSQVPKLSSLGGAFPLAGDLN